MARASTKLQKSAYVRPPLDPAKGCVGLLAQRGRMLPVCSLLAPCTGRARHRSHDSRCDAGLSPRTAGRGPGRSPTLASVAAGRATRPAAPLGSGDALCQTAGILVEAVGSSHRERRPRRERATMRKRIGALALTLGGRARRHDHRGTGGSGRGSGPRQRDDDPAAAAARRPERPGWLGGEGRLGLRAAGHHGGGASLRAHDVQGHPHHPAPGTSNRICS